VGVVGAIAGIDTLVKKTGGVIAARALSNKKR